MISQTGLLSLPRYLFYINRRGKYFSMKWKSYTWQCPSFEESYGINSTSKLNLSYRPSTIKRVDLRWGCSGTAHLELCAIVRKLQGIFAAAQTVLSNYTSRSLTLWLVTTPLHLQGMFHVPHFIYGEFIPICKD